MGCIMGFVYDPSKSAANLEKHGIDFEEVQDLWLGDTVAFRAITRGEPRFKVIGRLMGEYWAAIYTVRGDDIRIISARRATASERSEYDRQIND